MPKISLLRPNKSFFLICILLSFFFLFFRLYDLEKHLNFASDQGFQFLEIYNLYQSKQISLIGPSSSFAQGGKSFFFGPAPYYVTMLPLVLTSWNPVSVSFFLIFLNLTSFIVLFYIILKRLKMPLFAYISALLFIMSPVMIRYSQFYWNPNYHLPISTLIVALIIYMQKNKSPFLFFAVGFLLGFGMQFHYAYFLAICASFIALIILKNLSIKKFVIISAGFLFGFAPIIIFELRHNFYNLQTFLAFITSPVHQTPSFQFYYLLSVWPFILIAVSYILFKILVKNKLLGITMLFIYIAWSTQQFLFPSFAKIPQIRGWNYQSEKKAVQIIKNQNKSKYSIIDILTGDTRAMALRFLLVTSGSNPLSVSSYPQAENIFLYTSIPISQIKKGSLWELDVVKPVRVVKKWHIDQDVYLYLLQKDSPPSTQN